MWIIYSKHEPDKIYYLSKCCTFSIGRHASHILIPDDSSISRHHADLIVEKDHKSNQFLLFVVDKSKYGTYLNNKKLIKGKKELILRGSTLELGARKSCFKFDFITFNFRASSLNKKDSEQLKKLASEIGAKVVKSVDDATHIVATQITLTMKVTMGLAKGIPIVALSYVKELCSTSQWNRPLPDPYKYMPFIISGECTEDILKIQPARRELLKNKTFVFISKTQFKFYRPLIELASGNAIDLTNIDDFNVNKLNEVIEENKYYCWIDPLNAEKKPDHIIQSIKKKCIQMIEVIEITKAILHLNVENYCNPVLPKRILSEFSNKSGGSEKLLQENILMSSSLLSQSKNIISNINKKMKESPLTKGGEHAKKSKVNRFNIENYGQNEDTSEMYSNLKDSIEMDDDIKDVQSLIHSDSFEQENDMMETVLEDIKPSQTSVTLVEDAFKRNDIENEPMFDIDFDQYDNIKETIDFDDEINPVNEENPMNQEMEIEEHINFKLFKKQKLMRYSDIVVQILY